MPRYSADHVPQYFHYKRTNKGAVKIAGKFKYLPGLYNSPESKQAYNRVISEWFASGRSVAVLQARQEAATAPDSVNVEQVIVAFWAHAKTYYRDREGKPTKELDNFKDALRTLRKLYGRTAAVKFDAASLEACQSDMIRQGLARNTINRRCVRIRQVFKFAVRKKLVPAAVLTELQTVEGLKMHRSDAKETEPVRGVDDEHVRAAAAHAGRQVAAMLELQLLTGMRSGELVIMRTADIDRGGRVWTYRPTKHKTQHHGHDRVVFLGEQAQTLLTPFLRLDQAAYLFSPADATRERLDAAAARRKTPLSCGNAAGTNRKDKPKRTPGTRYTTGSYARAVTKACEKAFPPPSGLDAAGRAEWQKAHRFHPHQIRHTVGTRVRREYGIDTQRAVLGQKSVEAAEIYGELDMGKARDVMAKIG